MSQISPLTNDLFSENLVWEYSYRSFVVCRYALLDLSEEKFSNLSNLQNQIYNVPFFLLHQTLSSRTGVAHLDSTLSHWVLGGRCRPDLCGAVKVGRRNTLVSPQLQAPRPIISELVPRPEPLCFSLELLLIVSRQKALPNEIVGFSSWSIFSWIMLLYRVRLTFTCSRVVVYLS
jgi:hypothetical protein